MASAEKGRVDRAPGCSRHVTNTTGDCWSAGAGHVGATGGPAPRFPRGGSESGPARAFTARPARAPVRRRHRGHGGGARPPPLRQRPGPRAPRFPRPERARRAPRPQQPGHGGQGRRGRGGRLPRPPRERRRRSGEDAGRGRAVRAERGVAAGWGRPFGVRPPLASPPLWRPALPRPVRCTGSCEGPPAPGPGSQALLTLGAAPRARLSLNAFEGLWEETFSASEGVISPRSSVSGKPGIIKVFTSQSLSWSCRSKCSFVV